MTRLSALVVDMLLVLLATVAAFLVRDDFTGILLHQPYVQVYLAVSVIAFVVVELAMGITRVVWQHSRYADFVRIFFASILTVLVATLVQFGVSRLDNISRSLPVIQVFCIFFVLAIARAQKRWRHRLDVRGEPSMQTQSPSSVTTVLVVGVDWLASLYIRCVEAVAAGRIDIAGLVDVGSGETGRSIGGHKVVGAITDLPDILRTFEVHGVIVSKIVVAEAIGRMSQESIEILMEIEGSSDVSIEFLTEKLGFESSLPGDSQKPRDPDEMPSKVSLAEAVVAPPGRYVHFKRGIDILGSSVLLAALSPVFVVVGAVVFLNFGSPILFWQRRPGMRGKYFKLFKFRSMGPSHSNDGRRFTDAERASKAGNFLRNTRLDELPQLVNIFLGEMSFVGPRPLLPVDQPERFGERLAVRPGLTGWAQVNGGRLVSPQDKGAMDAFYVRKLSFFLDMSILIRTVPMILFRESSNDAEVARAWAEIDHQKSPAERLQG